MAFFIQSISPLQTLDMNAQAQAAGSTGGASLPFSGVLKDAVSNLQQAEQVANQDAYDLALGNTDDLSGLMINSTKYTTALEFTVQLSTRIVNAYKEVMQMQV